MILPRINGQCNQNTDYIFAVADSYYFDTHGKPLINSILKNTEYGIHIHIYNPSDTQLEFCNKPRVSVSYEYIDPSVFNTVADEWQQRVQVHNIRQQQMIDKFKLLGKPFLIDNITKAYYACCRFVRLSEIMDYNNRVLSIDVDGIVRKNFSMIIENDYHDFYLYQKKSTEHLAGALLLTQNSRNFVEDYARNIKKRLEIDDIYWFMDQVVLDKIVNKYDKGLLPKSYIDWEMDNNSSIWSAKGKRKSLDIFINEQKIYNF
jgi:hypothetical protein